MTLLQRITITLAMTWVPAANAQLTIQGSLPDGNTNQAYIGQLTCNSNNPQAAWSVTGGLLPTGLSLGYTGCAATISGTPIAAGTYVFTIQASSPDFINPAIRSFSVKIQGALGVATASVLPSAVAGQPYSFQFSANGGIPPYTWSLLASGSGANSLPPGLTLTSGGALSGTPKTAGNYGFDIAVADQGGANIATHFEMVVTPPMAITTSSPLPTGTINTAYSQQIAVSGGTSPYTFSITTPATAPPGMVISSAGLLGGVPKSTGTYTFTIQAQDKYQYSTTKQFQVSIAPAGALLQTSLKSMTFSGAVAGETPPLQSFAVTAPSGTPVNFAVTVDGGNPGTAAPGWISVTPTSGPAPAGINVAANQNGLQPGKYTATIHVNVPNNTSQTPIDIPVTFNVASGTAQLSALPVSLRFASRAAASSAQDQMIVIRNSGGGGSINFGTSVAGKSSWITAISPASGRAAPNAPAALRVFVNSQGLIPGFYHDTIRITSTSGNIDVPVEMHVSDQGPVIGLSTSGVRFQVRQGAGSSLAQPISVLNLGDPSTTSGWQAQLVSELGGSDWLSVGTPNGTSTQLRPGTFSLIPSGGAANLAPGPHYALISVTDPNAINSPQYLVAVADVAPAASSALPDPAPQGLFFTSNGPAQNISVYTSSTAAVGFQVGTATNDGNPWLSATPASGTASTASPGQISVSIQPGSLPVGVYSGYVHISMNGAMRSVNVTMMVLPGAGPQIPSAATCTASRLAITQTGLVDNFALPAGWPATLAVQVNDDCANPISNASVVATFSNGDPPLTLRGDQVTNTYSATWQPGVVQPSVTVTIRATTPTLPTASQQCAGAVNQNTSGPPTLVPDGALHIFFTAPLAASLGAGLAPGNVAQIYGASMAPAASQTMVPLPSQFGGTQMLIGGKQAPLFYVSDQLLDVQIPTELTPNRQYSMVVSSNGGITLPAAIDVTAVQPGVAQLPDGTAIAQVSGTTTLISASNPAKPGQNLTIYLAGMGPTNPAVASGQPTPLQAVPVTNQPTVTLDGETVSYSYAGLTPTGVGLYQINLTVPQDARAGNLDLIVTQNGVASNTTKLPVSN